MKRLAMLAALVLMPLAQAHGTPTVLDVEVQIIEDETNDATYLLDGYDLQSLHVRQVHWRQAGTDGLMFRVIASGGTVTPAAGPSAIEVDVDIGGGVETYRFETSDDSSWSGDLEVIEENNVAGESGETVANFQFLLPTPGIQPDTEISGFAMRSYSGDQMVDAAPGGLYGPAGEIPNSGSSTIKDSIAWEGPIGYTETTVTRTETGATLDVANRITVSGQHITARVGDADGWAASIVGDLAASVDASQGLTFDLRIDAIGAGPLQIDILTDVGGREVLILPGQADDPEQPLPPGQTTEAPPEEESPALPLGILLLGLLALARRR